MYPWGLGGPGLLLPLGALYVLLGVTQGPCREGTQATGLGSRSRKALVPWSTLLHGVAVAGGWERGLKSPPSHRAGQKGPQDPMPLWPCPELLASLCPRVNTYCLAPCQGVGKGLWRGAVLVGSHNRGGVTRPWDTMLNHKASSPAAAGLKVLEPHSPLAGTKAAVARLATRRHCSPSEVPQGGRWAPGPQALMRFLQVCWKTKARAGTVCQTSSCPALLCVCHCPSTPRDTETMGACPSPQSPFLLQLCWFSQS